MVGTNEEVMDHYPPQYIVGQPIEEIECYVEEQDLITVRMFKITCEYMYGNPTGKYNLSLPEKKLRSHLNFREREKSYSEWKKSNQTGEAPELKNDDQNPVNLDEPDEDAEFEGLDVRQWHDHSLVGEVLLKIDIENTCREQIKVEIGIASEDDSKPLNCKLPVTSYYTQIYAKGMSVRPVMALIQKIDPSKPFGNFKLTIGAKRIRTNFSNVGRSYNMGTDPTNQTYRDVVSQINQGGTNAKRSVGFFVTSTGDTNNENGGNTNVEVTGQNLFRRGGLNMGEIPDDEPEDLNNGSMSSEGDRPIRDGIDGRQSFGSNNNNLGSDLEDDLQIKP